MTSELASILHNPVSYWNLDIESGSIKKSSTLQKMKNYCYSFFSNSHKNTLLQMTRTICLSDIHENIQGQIDRITDLAHNNKNVWFREIKNDLPKPIPLLTHDAGLIKDYDLLTKPYEKEGKFYNYKDEPIYLNFLETIRLLFPGTTTSSNEISLSEISTNPKIFPTVTTGCRLTWIGHSTFLIQTNGINILTDPSFNFVFPCFLRHTKPAIDFDSLPKIDVIVLSHNHEDHCMVHPFIEEQPSIFAPQKLDKSLKEQGFSKVSGHQWWQKRMYLKANEPITITAVPAVHGSQTGLFDTNETLWQGFVIETSNTKIYFSGDTATHDSIFEEINSVFGEIDYALLPIAPEGEELVHLNCKQALDVFRRLNAKKMIPMHWGAYRMGREKIEDPKNLLLGYLDAEYKDLKEKVLLLAIGESLTIRDSEKDSLAI